MYTSVDRGVWPLIAIIALGLGLVDLASAATPDPEAGRRMYREGILASGEPLTAIVAGDVPVLGTQFSCESCHGRSGMGASEGAYIVPPVAAQFLFVESPQPPRPAYTAESLSRLLRDGVTPGGRTLSEQLMPRYQITDDDMASLTSYLATLSAGNSPGVDDTVIRFATVISADANPVEREALLAVLNQFAADKNSQTRLESERWDRGYTPASRLPTVHRDWVVEEWMMTGPSGTWDEQLEQHYQSAPVFALLSGLSNDSWGPVSRFCERREIPCLFPGTDSPEPAEDDFYTLYYSRGLELEAGLIAHHVAAQPVPGVLQVYCSGEGARAANGLRLLLEGEGVAFDNFEFDCQKALPVAELAERMSANPEAATVLWLPQDQVDGIAGDLPPGRIYFSSTLLDGEFEGSFLSIPGPVFVAHPFRLPGRSDPAFARFNVWAKTRGVELNAPRLQSEAFFACLALKDAVAHMGRFFVRDFVLDILDHAQSLTVYLPFYPRPTFGPHQRFVNKGGYILPVLDGKPDTTNAAWILP